MIENIKGNSGWLVASWGWFLAHCPCASSLLIYLSCVVAALQIIVLCRKIKKNG